MRNRAQKNGWRRNVAMHVARLHRGQRAAATFEYSAILGIIVIAVVATSITLGNGVRAAYAGMTGQVCHSTDLGGSGLFSSLVYTDGAAWKSDDTTD